MHIMNPVRLRTGAAALTAIFAVAACQDQEVTNLQSLDELAGEASVASMEFSTLTAAAGETVTANLEILPAGGEMVAGVDGQIRWNPAALTYTGQIVEQDGSLVVVNDSEASQGVLTFQALNPRGLGEDVATLGFRVEAPGYDRGVDFEPVNVVNLSSQQLDVVYDGVEMEPALPAADGARVLSFADWSEILTGSRGDYQGPMRVADEATIYGDGDLNNTINVLDNLYLANVSVGNQECIIGTDGPARDCIAGDVRPVGPPVGNNVVDVLDNLAIALESVTPGSQDVVGDPIPQQAKEWAAGDTLCFPGAGTYSGDPALNSCQIGPDLVVTSNVTLDPTRLYILPRVVRFGDDGTQGTGSIAYGSLTIPAGTRVEGTDSSAIVITRAGQLFANGTEQEPVTLTCVDDAGTGLREPQCWGGVYLAGTAVVNESDGLAPSPPDLSALPHTSSTTGRQRAAEGFVPADLFFGGNDDASSCGELTYVSIQYGGRSVAANNELNNLTTGACGAGTVISHVQTHAGSDDGFEFFGGRQRSEYLYATANDDDQLDYSFGFDGDIQYVIIQQRGTGDSSFEVDNTEDPATYGTATPFTNSNVWNLTVVGGTAADAESNGRIRYRRGAASTLSNVLHIASAREIQVDNAESCSQVGAATNPLDFQGYLILSSSADIGGDCITDVQNYLAAQQASGEYEARAYNGELRDPFSFNLPDFRPSGPIAGPAPIAPPAGFGPGDFLGAVPDNGSGAIPWYLGWTVGWQTSTAR